MIYKEWGFKQNPFSTAALEANELGSQLLRGRDTLIDQLQKKIENYPKAATVEGINGAGKTSVINVASYRLMTKSISGSTDALFLPCRTIFQLRERMNPDSFRRKVLLEVAQTLLENLDRLPATRGKTRATSNKPLDRYLNSPQLPSLQAGAATLSIGGGWQNSSTVGFDQSGFEKIVIDFLTDVFPREECGGVVCAIDNLELLRTSAEVQNHLENLRDMLFSIPGIRWVFSGACGVVRGVASTPRMNGYLHRPIEVGEVSRTQAGNIFNARVDALKAKKSAELPMTPRDFLTLFDTFHGNLRDIFSASDDYCAHIYDVHENELSEVLHFEFGEWLEEEAASVYKAVENELGQFSRAVFLRSGYLKSFLLSEIQRDTNWGSEKLRISLRQLEQEGVIASTTHARDKRKKVYSVSPKGWLALSVVAKTHSLRGAPALIGPAPPPDSDWYKDSRWSGETVPYDESGSEEE